MDSGLNRIHQPYHPKVSSYRLAICVERCILNLDDCVIQKSPHGRQQTAGHTPFTTGWSPLMQHTAISHQSQNIPQPLPWQPHVSGRAHHRDYTSTSGGERGPQVFHCNFPTYTLYSSYHILHISLSTDLHHHLATTWLKLISRHQFSKRFLWPQKSLAQQMTLVCMMMLCIPIIRLMCPALPYLLLPIKVAALTEVHNPWCLLGSYQDEWIRLG